MEQGGDRVFQVPAYEVPAYEAMLLQGKHGRYCLVIPVVNEGERIRRQLRRLKELMPGFGLEPLDLVIADGGSDDGSLDVDFLQEQGVTALLTKTGAGGLGAQLRMAYSWLLKEGYEGVITVDGNGKDGLEAVPRFHAKLEEGYDYVQGSRYIAGGEALNTPWDRELFSRWLHAPLLSFKAGRRYTDTTNGFRAYSRRLLECNGLAIFREVFDRYSLLFYISAYAPRQGLRCCEIPVKREYPARVAVPTKIGGPLGKIKMLVELLLVVCGRLAPRDSAGSPREVRAGGPES